MNKILISVVFLVLIAGFTCLPTEAIVYGSNENAGKYIDIDDIRMYYEIYGDGEPLLLLHENGGSIESFSNQIPEFQKNYKIIALDSRAHGRTTDSDKELTYNQMASDVKLFLDALKLDNVNVVGWSDGGNIGLILAQTYPAKVKKLVAIGANFDPSGYYPPFLNMISVVSYDMLDAKAKQEFTHLSPNPEKSPIIFKKHMDLMAKYPKLTPGELANIKTPVMVMVGDHDLIQEEHTIKLFQSLPNAFLAVIPGASHIVLKEKPEIMNRLIIDFLQKPFSPVDRFYFLAQ